MPKIVDHEARRREIADALWRVVRRDGLHAASVRTVAAEAGWSPSATRHYFTSQDELLAFAMTLILDRVRADIGALPAHESMLETVRAALYQVLPMDRQGRQDNEVWLAMVARAQVDPTLRRLRGKVHDAVRGLAQSAILALSDAGLLRAGVDVELETDRLHALLDGLATHAAIRPTAITPQRMRAVLDAHLAGLTGR